MNKIKKIFTARIYIAPRMINQTNNEKIQYFDKALIEPLTF